MESLSIVHAFATQYRVLRRIFPALLLLVLLSACSRNRKEIALLTPTTGNPIWDTVHTGAAFGAAACGLKVHYDGPPRADDLRTQLELFKTFSDSRYATIAVVPIHERAMRDPIGRIASRGQAIIVIGTDLGITNPNITYVLNDEEEGGRLAADKIGDLLHGNGKIAVMGVDLAATSILTREHAVEQELSTRFPKIHIVQRTRGSANLFEEQQSAERLLAENELDAIVALTSFATRGAFYAVDTRHPTHRVHIVGFDQDLTLPMRDAKIDAIVALRAHDIGKLVSQLACDHLRRKPWGGPHVVKPFLITPENVDSPEVAAQINNSWWELADENK